MITTKEKIKALKKVANILLDKHDDKKKQPIRYLLLEFLKSEEESSHLITDELWGIFSDYNGASTWQEDNILRAMMILFFIEMLKSNPHETNQENTNHDH